MGSKDSQVAATLQDGNKEDEEDDWEAIADRGENDETLALAHSLEQQAKVSPSSSSEKISTPSSGPRRRGRGSFLYDKSVLYSDQCGLENDVDEEESNDQSGSKGRVDEQKHKTSASAKQYGTRHVLVLYDFPPSILAADLEKIFEKFGDHGVAIRWVNDTVALAVFRTPSAANEAQACIPPRYKVRLLKEDDDLLTKNDGIDLEPPNSKAEDICKNSTKVDCSWNGAKAVYKLRVRRAEETRGSEEEPNRCSTSFAGRCMGFRLTDLLPSWIIASSSQAAPRPGAILCDLWVLKTMSLYLGWFVPFLSDRE